jgi:hypothetical protein
VLEGVKGQIRQPRSVLMTAYSDHAAIFFHLDLYISLGLPLFSVKNKNSHERRQSPWPQSVAQGFFFIRFEWYPPFRGKH